MCAPKEEGGNCIALLRAPPDETKKFADNLSKEGPANLWFKSACGK
jgi:hypothetical protein